MAELLTILLGVAALTWLARLLPAFVELLRRSWPVEDAPSALRVGAPARRPLGECMVEVLCGPVVRFHHRTSRLWTVGYVSYHLAIGLVVTGYLIAALALAAQVCLGHRLPALAGDGVPATGLGHAVALIFANAEAVPSRFLFGSAAPVFRSLGLVELPCAVVGNACMLMSALTRRWGSVRHALDPVTRELRLPGGTSLLRIAIRLAILALIIMELIGRSGAVPAIAYAHAALGLLLVAAVPFTYLGHIPWTVVALALAVKRRRRNAVA